MVNIYEAAEDGELIANLKSYGLWPRRLIGTRLDELILNKADVVKALDLIRLVLRDGQERAIETSVWTPRGILFRRLTFYLYTKTSVAIIATRSLAHRIQRR